MNVKIRRLLAVLLLAALPLQGQAVAAMTCHSSHGHGHAAADVISEAKASHHNAETEPAAQLASGCALCAASCAMAHVIPVRLHSAFPQLQSSSLTSSPASHYASVVLEGLLRPPRS